MVNSFGAESGGAMGTGHGVLDFYPINQYAKKPIRY
jgi:hypothetical protein